MTSAETQNPVELSIRQLIKIIPNTKFFFPLFSHTNSFVVDGFTIKNKENYKFWFLSHFHADHYAGITKNKWKHGTIICTQSTKNLIKLKFGGDHEQNIQVVKCKNSSWFKDLVEEKTIIDGVTVTFFDANHWFIFFFLTFSPGLFFLFIEYSRECRDSI
jgi:hypothetical protein